MKKERPRQRVSWLYSILSILGIGGFVYSLFQMSELQSQMNYTMAAIRTSVAATGSLVGETSDALTPLSRTTEALQNIEKAQTSTVSHLASMNAHLKQIALAEQVIVTNINALNQSTDAIGQQLTTMANLNESIFATSQTSVGQARAEAEYVGTLNNMTGTSIQQIHTMNQKLSALRLLP